MIKEIKVRADGSSSIGMGHLYRTFSLVEPFLDREGWHVKYYSINSPVDFFKSNVLDVQHISDERQFLDSVTQNDIVLVDNYDWTYSQFRAVKDRQAKLVIIDDLADRPLIADVVINHSPDPSIHYDSRNVARTFLGPRFALLSKVFRMKRESNRVADSVFICFGGSDPLDLSSKWARILSRHFTTVFLVTGCANINYESIQSTVREFENVQHQHCITSEQMAYMFKSAEFGLVPASTILFEALSCGLVTMSGHFVSNQKSIYDGFVSLGSIIGLGDLGQAAQGNIDHLIRMVKENEWTELRSINSSIFDGQSIDRLVSVIEDLRNV